MTDKDREAIDWEEALSQALEVMYTDPIRFWCVIFRYYREKLGRCAIDSYGTDGLFPRDEEGVNG